MRTGGVAGMSMSHGTALCVQKMLGIHYLCFYQILLKFVKFRNLGKIRPDFTKAMVHSHVFILFLI